MRAVHSYPARRRNPLARCSAAGRPPMTPTTHEPVDEGARATLSVNPFTPGGPLLTTNPFARNPPIPRSLRSAYKDARFEWDCEIGDGGLSIWGVNFVHGMASGSAEKQLPRWIPGRVARLLASAIAWLAYGFAIRRARRIWRCDESEG
jgi:hypothetical protein